MPRNGEVCDLVKDPLRLVDYCVDVRRAIEALGSALAGSDRPLIVTSGTAFAAPGQHRTGEGRFGVCWTAVHRLDAARLFRLA